MKTNFVINQKLLGNPSTIYKTVKTQTINEEVNNLCAAMTALDPAFEGVNPIELKKNELIEWYQKEGLHHHVKGFGELQEIFADIKQVIDGLAE